MSKLPYDEEAMKNYMRKFKMPKQKRTLCVAGIEMYLLREEDIEFIADEKTTYTQASNRLHNLIVAS